MDPTLPDDPDLVSTGAPGLDVLLRGGLPARRFYLLKGDAGTGKTTMGMQFLVEGARRGETALLISLAETRDDLLHVAASHGWTLEGVDIYEVTAAEVTRRLKETQTVFPIAEVELSEVTDEIVELLRATRPQRVVFDAITELRLMADHPIRYRRQILTLRNVLDEIQATAILTDTDTYDESDNVLDSLAHGIIHLERWAPDYGSARRRLEITKLRGRDYYEGWHDIIIERGGVRVFPRPRRQHDPEHTRFKQLASNVGQLDALLGGGLEMGTACLIAGGSGTGKSTIASIYLHAALQEGLRAAAFIFDERPETFYKRSRDIGAPLDAFVENGQLTVRAVKTGEISPGEFAGDVSRLVEETGVSVVIVDSLTGYLRAMTQEKSLVNQMHDLLNYLSERGVLTILIVTHHGMYGELLRQDLDLSYLSDTVILIRHFESGGSLHKAISVVKKRHGPHEMSIRKLRIDQQGVALSEPLQALRGVLTGNPVFEDDDTVEGRPR